MHEFVVSAERLRLDGTLKRPAMDIAKRLLDYGFHPPTVYFPTTVHEGMMIEPTETESKETLDQFAAAILQIIEEDPELLEQAPHLTQVSRPDEVRAARQAVMKWTAD
jgi:glycine dehydrogenase subunit 2